MATEAKGRNEQPDVSYGFELQTKEKTEPKNIIFISTDAHLQGG